MSTQRHVLAFGFVLVAGLQLAPCALAQGHIRHHDGPGNSDEFGAKVAICGDIDLDGTADYLVGAPGSGGATKKGEAYAYSGATGALIWSWTGEFGSNAFGMHLSGAGDVDADGYEDVLIGAPNFPGPALLKGRIYLYSGATGLLIQDFTGGVSEQEGPVAGLGDINGDTYSDFLTGIPESAAGVKHGGLVYALSGSGFGAFWKVVGTVAGGLLGSCFAVVGDLDFDGIPEVAIGEPSNLTYAALGSVYLVNGRDGSVLQTFSGGVTLFGSSIAGVGDVDGDTFGDLLVGSPLENGGSGAAFLYSGYTGAHIHTFKGAGVSDQLGVSVSGGGDVNGDGINDLILGALDDALIAGSRGRFHVHSGDAVFGYPLLTSLPGFADKDLFGASVAGFALLDAGKLGDFVVGAPGTDGLGTDRGAVHVYAGDDLFLFHDKRGYFAGDYITLDTRQGSPYQPALLFVAAFSGTPFFNLLVIGGFDGFGDFPVLGIVPPGLAGYDADFLSFGFDPFIGKYRNTTLTNVQFL